MSDRKLSGLLSYLPLGLRLLPIWPVTASGACACGNASCSSAGKHPLAPLARRGLHDASSRDEVITHWHETRSDANWAVATGARLVVIDVDVKRGAEGAASIARLEAELGVLPHTLRANTPSGGWHLYYLLPEGAEVRNSASRLAPGIDVRGDGGYVVCPPSITLAGAYTWADDLGPGEAVIEALPDAWVERLRAAPPVARAGRGAEGQVHEGGRNEQLFRAACALRGRGLSEDALRVAVHAENVARCVPPLDATEVDTIVTSAARYDCPPPPAAEPLAEPPPEAHLAVAVEADWERDLAYTGSGQARRPKSSLANLVTILANDRDWRGVLAYDEFSEIAVFRRPAPFAADVCRGERLGEITDTDDALTCVYFQRRWLCDGVTPQNAAAALTTVARRHSYHPVRDYLHGLVWDGQHRAHDLLTRYFGAARSSVAQRVGAWLLIGAVARVMRPGCKLDTVPVLEGRQGDGKSSGLRALFGDDWFSDDAGDLGDPKRFSEVARGKWGIELGELAAIQGKALESVKRVISAQEDRYRPAYGRRAVSYPRQCLLIGTTNRDDYLSDPTGNRRWLPVRVGTVDVDAIERDRDQIWAEAVSLYRAGEAWWTAADDPEIVEAQSARDVGDAWTVLVARWLDGCPDDEPVTAADLLGRALALDPSRWDLAAQRRIGQVMRRLGWDRLQRRSGGAREWVYVRGAVSEKNLLTGGDGGLD